MSEHIALGLLLLALAAALPAIAWLAWTPRRAAPAPQAPQHARDLVPAFSAADPAAPSAGTVRVAFRGHVMWLNQLSVVVMSFRDLMSMDMDDETRALQLCELYSRAIFESAFAAHFDGTDPGTDKVVLSQIADALGSKTAAMVHDRVASCGVVLRKLKMG